MAFATGGGSTAPKGIIIASGKLPPAAPREFRAAWVSTVANIDWPSKPGLPVARQQSEALAILDRAAAVHDFERAEADERLRLSEQRYALAARGANDGLWDWDVADDRAYFSPRLHQLLGGFLVLDILEVSVHDATSIVVGHFTL